MKNNLPGRDSASKRCWWRRLKIYLQLCQTSGYIPRTSLWLQKTGKFLARIWAFVQIGEVRVIGAENLLANDRLLYCPNHSSMLDAIVLYPYLPVDTHYMSAVEQMRGAGGIKALIMGAAGCFPVDRQRGSTVIEPAIDLVASGKRMTLFPEGKISQDGKFLPFKKGAARIAIGASNKIDGCAPVGIVPITICYGRRDNKTALGPYFKMGLRWRGGATVTVGAPIYIHEFDKPNPDNVTDVLRHELARSICELDDSEIAETPVNCQGAA